MSFNQLVDHPATPQRGRAIFWICIMSFGFKSSALPIDEITDAYTLGCCNDFVNLIDKVDLTEESDDDSDVIPYDRLMIRHDLQED